MDTVEFSREFDMLWNNVMSDAAPGLTEYEKSLFLTQAQASVVSALYSGLAGRSFEETEENASYLDQLTAQATITETEEVDAARHIVPESVFFRLPADLMFRTYESCTVEAGGSCGDMQAAVIPVTQDEFWRAWGNPFRGPGGRRVLRLSAAAEPNGEPPVNLSELVGTLPVKSYLVRYVRHPRPIVLEDLPDGLTIDGYSKRTECELNAHLHRKIVLEAVNTAKSVWS